MTLYQGGREGSVEVGVNNRLTDRQGDTPARKGDHAGAGNTALLQGLILHAGLADRRRTEPEAGPRHLARAIEGAHREAETNDRERGKRHALRQHDDGRAGPEKAQA